MGDKKDYQAKLEKLTDEEIIFKREYMHRRKQGWADEVLEKRKRQRSKELDRRKEASSRERNKTARIAKNAAVIAAIAAIMSAIWLVISYLLK